MKVTFLVRGKRYALKDCVVRGPDGKKDRLMSTLARVYQATWRPAYGDPTAYAGRQLANAQGGTAEVVMEKKDEFLDEETGIAIWH